jgi:hypothetical protein
MNLFYNFRLSHNICENATKVNKKYVKIRLDTYSTPKI